MLWRGGGEAVKFARSLASGVIGAIVFLILLAIWAVIVDERCSKNASETDITWEEVSK